MASPEATAIKERSLPERLRYTADRLAFSPAWDEDLLEDAAQEIEALRDLLAAHMEDEPGRYIVLCDDGSLVAVDSLMDGDDVLLDRGDNGS